MLGVDAGSVAAEVVEIELGGHIIDKQLEDDAVRGKDATGPADLAVAVPQTGGPDPAPPSDLDLRGEAVG